MRNVNECTVSHEPMLPILIRFVSGRDQEASTLFLECVLHTLQKIIFVLIRG